MPLAVNDGLQDVAADACWDASATAASADKAANVLMNFRILVVLSIAVRDLFPAIAS
jgi:hypothetical protein